MDVPEGWARILKHLASLRDAKDARQDTIITGERMRACRQ